VTRRHKKEYEEFLCASGYSETFPKKHARILLNVKFGKILSLSVENFKEPNKKQHLYNEFDSYFGNCLSDWNDWSFPDVLIKLFVSYNVDVGMRKKILFELSKVDEWRPEVGFWIFRNWGDC